MPDPPEPAPAGDAASRQPTPASASGTTPAAVPEPPPIPMIMSDIPSSTAAPIQPPAVASPTVPAPTTNGITANVAKPSGPIPGFPPNVQQRPANFTPAASQPPPVSRAPLVPAPRHTAPPAPQHHVNHQGYIGRSDPRVAKPIIVDPPGTRISQNAIQASGFPSPGRDHAQLNTKFNEDVSRLTFAVKQAVPDAVRRVVRDNWEKCVLGSDFHQAFVMNATIHRANPTITKRAIRDFGSQLVNVGKREIVELFSTKDIDEVADIILEKASPFFLDRALERRLTTIEAKPLINALARAERLGYERGDIVEEPRAGQPEKVIPHEKLAPQQRHVSQPQPMPMQGVVQHPVTPGGPPGLQPGQQWMCDQCFRIFHAKSAHEHHVRKTVCKRAAPTPEGFKFSCPHCGQGFTTDVGLQYHINNKVCGDFINHVPPNFTPQPPQGPQMGNMASSAPMASRAPQPSTPNSNTKGPNPYAHLTPEQTAAMNDELQQAEIKYSDKFRAAEDIVDPAEKRVRLDSLRNSFGTKQSMIRKKYGVRLRERRTRAEIQAERDRMGRSDVEGQPGRKTAPAVSTPSGATPSTVAMGGPSAWRAANTHTPQSTDSAAHDAKRRRLEGGGAAPGYSSPMPQGASPLAHKPVNGAASIATPQTAGRPDTPASQVYEQSGARVEVHVPPTAAAAPAPGSVDEEEEAISRQLALEEANDGSAAADGSNRGNSVDQAISLDDEEDEDDDDDDDSEDDDEDIPAELPAAVMAGLKAVTRT